MSFRVVLDDTCPFMRCGGLALTGILSSMSNLHCFAHSAPYQWVYFLLYFIVGLLFTAKTPGCETI